MLIFIDLSGSKYETIDTNQSELINNLQPYEPIQLNYPFQKIDILDGIRYLERISLFRDTIHRINNAEYFPPFSELVEINRKLSYCVRNEFTDWLAITPISPAEAQLTKNIRYGIRKINDIHSIVDYICYEHFNPCSSSLTINNIFNQFIKNCELPIVQWAFEHFNVSIPNYAFFYELSILNPIHIAAIYNRLPTLQWLISLKPDFELTTQNNFIFTVAVQKNALDVIKWFVSNLGIDPNYQDNKAFKEACVFGHLKMAQYLFDQLNHNHSIQWKNILFYVATNRHLTVSEWLIQHHLANTFVIEDIDSVIVNIIKYLCPVSQHNVFIKELYEIYPINPNLILFTTICNFRNMELAQWVFNLPGFIMNEKTKCYLLDTGLYKLFKDEVPQPEYTTHPDNQFLQVSD